MDIYESINVFWHLTATYTFKDAKEPAAEMPLPLPCFSSLAGQVEGQGLV